MNYRTLGVSLGSCVASRYRFFFQAEDGIRYLVRSRGLGDVYKRQLHLPAGAGAVAGVAGDGRLPLVVGRVGNPTYKGSCLL